MTAVAAGRAVVVCDQWLGSNGYAGMKALRRAGWAVHVMPEWEYVPVRWSGTAMRVAARALRAAAAREFNDALVRAVTTLRPELLLVFKGVFVEAEALQRIRALGTRVYCFYPDVSMMSHGPRIPRALRVYDWIFTTKSFGVRDLHDRLGVDRASVLLHGYDPDLHRPVQLSAEDVERYACDVSFIGTWSPKKERMLGALVDALPDVHIRIWGEQWHKRSDRRLDGVIGGHEVVGEEYVRAIAASRINLCVLSEQRPGASQGDAITSRTFHIPASGGFMLHERTDEVLAIFEEDASIATFDGADDLIAQVQRWLADDAARERVARCGLEVVRRAHSWDNRIATILAHHQGARAHG